MLSKYYRFHGHGSLKYLFKNASSERSRYVTLRITANSRRTHTRCAVVISKKVHKSAVGRNRIRRRVYEILRQHIGNLNGVYDIAVIITSAEAIFAPHEELERQIVSLLMRARAVNSDTEAEK